MRIFTRIAIATLILFGTTTPATATHGNEGPCVEVPIYEVVGTASNYSTTAGFSGQPVVALPLAMGGCYTGSIHGYVDVCATTCARLPVADYCQCYWGTPDQRVIDLSHAAWEIISDQPLSVGLIEVTVIYNGDASPTPPGGGTLLPNTAMR
jgi:hypothetical protein